MTIKDIYALKPTKITHTLYEVNRHFPNVDFYNIEEETSTRLEIRYYADECFDGERGWSMFSLYFDGKPFMLCQEAGRGNQDFTNQHISDRATYDEFVAYLHSLYAPDPKQDEDIVGLDEDLPCLTEFYNHQLSDFYDANLKPKYKIGDVVMAYAPKNHLSYSNEKVLTRIKIERLEQFNPTRTYWGIQLDRRWDSRCDVHEMVTDPGKGSVGCAFNDDAVVGYAET